MWELMGYGQDWPSNAQHMPSFTVARMSLRLLLWRLRCTKGHRHSWDWKSLLLVGARIPSEEFHHHSCTFDSLHWNSDVQKGRGIILWRPAATYQTNLLVDRALDQALLQISPIHGQDEPSSRHFVITRELLIDQNEVLLQLGWKHKRQCWVWEAMLCQFFQLHSDLGDFLSQLLSKGLISW